MTTVNYDSNLFSIVENAWKIKEQIMTKTTSESRLINRQSKKLFYRNERCDIFTIDNFIKSTNSKIEKSLQNLEHHLNEIKLNNDITSLYRDSKEDKLSDGTMAWAVTKKK
jgi:hypothetical protein